MCIFTLLTIKTVFYIIYKIFYSYIYYRYIYINILHIIIYITCHYKISIYYRGLINILKYWKNKIISIPFLLLITFLIISGSLIITYYFRESKDKTIDNIIFQEEIDDRISPLENQGLILEVLRIRHRGLYERLKTPGNSWKKEPTFYFISEIDGQIFESKNIEQHGRKEEILFNTWDSMFEEYRIMRDVKEEQKTSKITLTIVEIETKGAILKRKTEIPRDQINLEYDYRTGRWKGDDNYKDKDGYGYYLGETFEIWFNIYQIDFDNDFIPYWTEVNILGTDPRRDDSKNDPDLDGIPTDWEWKYGYDPHTWDDHKKLDPDLDGIENIEEYQTRKWFADPYAQDIYVEVDVMRGNGLFDRNRYFYKECQQAIIEKFAEHDIRIYFDDGWPGGPINGGGDLLPFYKKLSGESGMMLRYYNNYFPDERKGIFRYLVVGNKGGFNYPTKGNYGDNIIISYDPLLQIKPLQAIRLLIGFGINPTIRGQRIAIAAVAMHEIGHTIGIAPWTFEGCDNNSYGFPLWPKDEYKWVDYRSVMNYQCIYDTTLLDYSHGTNGPPYDQNDWEKISISVFQFNHEYVPEPSDRDFLDPNNKVWDETEIGVTGYVYDENLTSDFVSSLNGWSPVDPIKANWSVFRLEDKNLNPNFREIKILAQPKDVPYASWSNYGDGYLDSNGNIQFYSQQKLIDNIIN